MRERRRERKSEGRKEMKENGTDSDKKERKRIRETKMVGMSRERKIKKERRRKEVGKKWRGVLTERLNCAVEGLLGEGEVLGEAAEAIEKFDEKLRNSTKS